MAAPAPLHARQRWQDVQPPSIQASSQEELVFLVTSGPELHELNGGSRVRLVEKVRRAIPFLYLGEDAGAFIHSSQRDYDHLRGLTRDAARTISLLSWRSFKSSDASQAGELERDERLPLPHLREAAFVGFAACWRRSCSRAPGAWRR
ncbi:hypothetical protein SETIT_9G375000v2 [Setaria italica]|uniref:Uncharacterized protein n=1 Tax=Setaria italica TaxID=4555 RepID=A0A368SPU2_SETIT|nr:hypothetical protein SETIT_9G375000v2 [Setaria italica]RCV44452.1 hypothetical protein SETIT_9G375000v2 [Setaria italica]RCV44453.1 hypothetical protein SETIT_9G375000v2 [Setaria italica]